VACRINLGNSEVRNWMGRYLEFSPSTLNIKHLNFSNLRVAMDFIDVYYDTVKAASTALACMLLN
jgi:hypothetical protein